MPRPTELEFQHDAKHGKIEPPQPYRMLDIKSPEWAIYSDTPRMRHREPRTVAYFERRRGEGLSDRDIIRCLKRHIANEVYKALVNPSTDNPVGEQLRATRQRGGVPITVLADTLAVPYQRRRRLEIGTRNDPELERQAPMILRQLSPPKTA